MQAVLIIIEASLTCTFCNLLNLTTNHHYDIIICGAGCSGLSLVMHLLQSEKFDDKKILLVDKDSKNTNDRTWCFWENKPGLFEPVVYKEWKDLWFYAHDFLKNLQLGPYTYKLIRGLDFYNYCFSEIRKHANIEFIQAPVNKPVTNEKEGHVVVNNQKYYASFIFNSILFEKPVLQKNHYWLLQHFKGWVIETDAPQFDPSSATLMDFRTSQQNGTSFFYLLPFTKNKALVEYTLFSKELLDKEAYETALKNYIEKDLLITGYTIQEKEFGVIPMTNYPFPRYKNNIFNIGTAGGQTKASSGYTFKFIQKQSAAIVKGLLEKNNPAVYLNEARRFCFYDSVLLQILNFNKMQGDEIFTLLFASNNASQILKFLDNETSVKEEIPILKSLPTLLFLKAGIKEILER